MIDPADKQTQALPLEQPKRGRGRPTTGTAMTPAEKQKAYRKRLKDNVTENANKAITEDLRTMLAEAIKRAELAEAERDVMGNELAILKAKLDDGRRNRLGKHARELVESVHEVAEALDGSSWRIQRKATTGGKWVTQKGSYWNQAKAEDALADIPQKKGGWWRVIEVKSDIED